MSISSWRSGTRATHAAAASASAWEGPCRTFERAAVSRTSAQAAGAGEDSAEQAVDAWIGARMDQVEALRGSVDEIETSGSGWTFAKLTIANGAIREVAGSAS